MAPNNAVRELVEDVARIRLAQLIVNEHYKCGRFRIPIHLALGHEAIAVGVDRVMTPEDKLVLTHRNIHYNIAREPSFKSILAEYYLRSEGVGMGRLGSMNLANPSKGVAYSSSILGNNFSVAAGIALGLRKKNVDGVTFVVTGDGAIEEGAFYESLCFLSYQSLPVVTIVENNQWSLATRIEERRAPIDLEALSNSMGVSYLYLKGNDTLDYCRKIQEIRQTALKESRPIVVEVFLSSLGDWRMETPDFPTGKYINYHAGPAPSVELIMNGLLREDESDPLFIMRNYIGEDSMNAICNNILNALNGEINGDSKV